MSDHHDEDLKAHVGEIADVANTRAPALAALRSRAVTRQRRRRTRAAAILSGATAILLGVGWVALSVQSDAPDPDAASDPTPVGVPTYPQGWGGDEALLRGELRFTASEGCSYVLSPGEAEPRQPIFLNFAPGHTGHVNAEGKREILDPDGNTLAAEGQPVHVTGGASGPATPEWTPRCQPDNAQYIVTTMAPGEPDAYPSG